MIANEYPRHYDGLPSITGEDTVDFANDMEVDHDYDVLPTIAAENAALKVKLKQECDIAHVTKNDISKTEIRIESLRRDITHCNELIDSKSHELIKLQEELTNLCVSRDHIKSSADNLKRQYELITIEDEQRKKEQDSIRANYEKMIRNKKEIFNSNRLVVRRNNLRNQCEGVRIQSAVLEERLKELHRQKRQFREIQNLHLKSASVELAQEWLNNKNEKDRVTALKNQLREKKDLYDQILSQKNKAESTTRSPGSRFVGLPMPTFSQPLHIPTLNAEETELTKYFRKINVFKKSRSPCLLPNVLTRMASLKEKESVSPKIDNISYQSPVKRNLVDTTNYDELKSKKSESPKPSMENTSKISAFQPVNATKTSSKEIVEIKFQDDGLTSNNEKPRQTPTSAIDNHSPNSPGKVNSKFKPVEKYVSPLTVSRASPLNTLVNKSPMRNSRIPVPLSSSSPIHAGSHAVRFSPIKANHKRDYVEKETISRRVDNVKKNEHNSPSDIQIDNADSSKKNQAFKRSDVGSPKRSLKIPKMDYAYLNVNRNSSRGAFDSGEIPTIEVEEEEEPLVDGNYREDELNVDALINEVNNKNNPMIKSHFERRKMLQEEYAATEIDDIELLKKSANKPESISRETSKTDIRPLNRNLSRGMPESDQIEENIDENDPTIHSYLEQLKMLREERVSKITWKERLEADDYEMFKKLAKDSKRPELAAHESYKLDTRHFIKNQTDVSNRYSKEFAKHYEKLQTNLYRREPKDFRAIEKADLEMNSKNSNSRFDKQERTIEKVADEGGRAQNKHNDLSYTTNNDYLDSSEKLSKSSTSSLDRTHSDVISPLGEFTSPPGSYKSSPPFKGALGEKGGSMFSYDTGVNQLFTLSTDGSSSQSQNQNNGFFNFNFGGSMDQTGHPLKLF